ncbi:MAG: hypothetical protein ABSE49_36285 [Polyangiaceae bacterium]
MASLTAVLAVPVLTLACAAAPQGGHNEGEGPRGEITATTSSAITSDDALSRAQQWVTAKLLYCQSANGQPDDDTSCSPVCMRESNPEWDPYRSDCSGFVSWAWDLPAPGRVTSEFAPFETDITTAIQASDLQPGDACNLTAGGHIVLFVQWVTPGKSALFMEEPGCSANPPYAHEFQSDVTVSGVNIDIAYEGESFTAIRYSQLTQSPADAGTPTEAGSPDTGAAGDDAGSGSSSTSSGGGSGSSGSSSGGSSSGSGTSSGGSTSSSSGSSSGSSGSSSGAPSSSSTGSGTAQHDGGAPADNASGATLDTNAGGLGCDVSGAPVRSGGGAGGVLFGLLGLALRRRIASLRPRAA